MQVLEHAFGRTGVAECAFDQLGAQGGLVGVLQDDGVACHQGRDDAVHGRQQRVVPRRDGQGNADGFTADEAGEARLVGHADGRQRRVGDRDHMARTRFKASDFARRVAQGASHLDRDGPRDLVLGRDETVDRRRHDAPPFAHAQRLPGGVRGLGLGQCLGDLRFAGIGAAHDLAPVDGTDGDEFLGHGGPMQAVGRNQMISK
ncbi:hypothetical protein G6F32_014790 [Rhizopus arrhizus]|nr:hypothetical protein G6F32_014790 [Rhizopus arrhizus]